MKTLAILTLIFFPFFLCEDSEKYHEKLRVKVLSNDQIYAFFNFTTNVGFDGEFAPLHYHLFPRSVGQLIQKHRVAEFRFAMTQGLWRYRQWGTPYSPSPPGAQLWVWFKNGTKNVNANWLSLTNSLSGLFCASLNLMNDAVAISPTMSFRPTGAMTTGLLDNNYLRYGTLGRENLCTENLTPWVKLLPCGVKVGPGALLDPSHLHHSRFLSISLQVRTVCSNSNCDVTMMQLQQHVSVVHDLRTTNAESPNFSFSMAFAKRIKPACPLAESSLIELETPTYVTITPQLKTEGKYRFLDLKTLKSDTDIKVKWQKKPGSVINSPSGILCECYLTGIGLEGGVTCTVTNHFDRAETIIYLHSLPWYLYVQFHTLAITGGDGAEIRPVWVNFTPARMRESPHVLEFVATIPARSSVDVSLRFTKGFLKWSEHPPDSNHGFYIDPAVITMATDFRRIYSGSLLVSLPVPDFSMPYNVICLVCTVLAIAFGSFHNIATRRLQRVAVDRPHPVKERVLQILSKLKRKKSDVGEKKE